MGIFQLIYMSEPSKDKWTEITQQFQERWNFLILQWQSMGYNTIQYNTIQYNTIQYPQRVASVSYKYKLRYSIVLQTVTDTRFTYVDVGD
jgi:hypothetical protein